MDSAFYTLQTFLSYTKGITYILIVVTLLAIAGFWRFLTERDQDE